MKRKDDCAQELEAIIPQIEGFFVNKSTRDILLASANRATGRSLFLARSRQSSPEVKIPDYLPRESVFQIYTRLLQNASSRIVSSEVRPYHPDRTLFDPGSTTRSLPPDVECSLITGWFYKHSTLSEEHQRYNSLRTINSHCLFWDFV